LCNRLSKVFKIPNYPQIGLCFIYSSIATAGLLRCTMKTTSSHNVKWPSLKYVNDAMNHVVSTGENYASFQIVCRSVFEGLFLLGSEAALRPVKTDKWLKLIIISGNSWKGLWKYYYRNYIIL